MERILEGKGVTKYFGALKAVDSVDFYINKGEILGLIGPNGAGKTTLLDLINGIHPLSEGKIYYKGKDITAYKPYQVAELGIARTFQIVKPFPGMTVRENVLVGALFGKSKKGITVQSALAKVDEVLHMTGLYPRRDFEVEGLTIPDRKRLELTRALAMDPEVLLLDEVMAGLNTKEIEEVIELIHRINKEMKITILVIEHVMKAIMEISHRIMVLHHGRKIADDTPQNVVNDPRVIEAYLGERYAKKRVKNESK